MLVIGITGTIGAGKGTIVDYLVKEKGFSHYSVRQYLIEELCKTKQPINRDTMTSMANDLRAKHSPSYIIDQLFDKALSAHTDVVIESIRTPGEVISLRNKGDFILFAVDADVRTRYERIKLRQSSTDHISWTTFLSNEAREMETDDPNKQNLKKCIEMADYTFFNDGSIVQLHAEVERILETIL